MTRQPSAIQPYFHPTTVAFIDDSADFLANLSLQLDSRLAFRLFQSPYDALVAINGGTAVSPLMDRFFSLYRDRGDASYAHHVIDLSLDMIHREVHDDCRFARVAVAVVDYDMPGIDGLEFCRNLRNPAIKKILLTGKADERVAVAAFNEGLIDRFIRKQDATAVSTLNEAVTEMQREYFSQVERMLSDALAVGSHGFLRDPAFIRYFEEVRRSLGLVEHYLACTPDGLLMLDAGGTAYLLIVQSEDMMRANHEIAQDQAAPADLLAALRSGRWLPYFWRTEGNYSPIYGDWRACLHPATEIQGQQRYACAIVKAPAGFDLRQVLCYGNYLDHLDAEGREGLA